jgi:hypothetical protein
MIRRAISTRWGPRRVSIKLRQRMDYFAQQLINGLVLGSIYGLIAIIHHGLWHRRHDQFRPWRHLHDRRLHALITFKAVSFDRPPCLSSC